MTDRLDRQIHDLMMKVVEESPSPPLLDDLRSGVPSVAVEQRQQRNGWAVALAAAALVLVLIGGVAWLAGRSDSPPAEQPPPTPAPPLGMGWVPLPEPPGGHFVASSRLGLVVVGLTEQGPEGGLDVWHSDEGSGWTLGTGIERDPNIYAVDVTDGGPGFVAVGNQLIPNEGLIWISTDGHQWERVNDDRLPTGACSAMYQVAANQDSVVALGCLPDGSLAAWQSTDGQAWHINVLSADSYSFAEITAGDFGFVVVAPPDVMFSADGRNWSPISNEALPSGGLRMLAVGGLLLAYDQMEGNLTVWSSDDQGRTWHETDMHLEGEFPAGEPLELHELIASPFGYVGVGMFGEMDETFEEDPGAAEGFIIHSWDGTEWLATPLEGAPPFTGLHATDAAIYSTFGLDLWKWSPTSTNLDS